MLMFLSSAQATWKSIQGRLVKAPVFQVVPEDWSERFDTVVMENSDYAWDRWPSHVEGSNDQLMRIEFWKNKILEQVSDSKMKGVVAGYYHEWTAAILRGMRRQSLGNIEARVREDAYAATAAGLEGYRIEFDGAA